MRQVTQCSYINCCCRCTGIGQSYEKGYVTFASDVLYGKFNKKVEAIAKKTYHITLWFVMKGGTGGFISKYKQLAKPIISPSHLVRKRRYSVDEQV